MKNYQKISMAVIIVTALVAFSVVIVNNYKTKTSFKYQTQEAQAAPEPEKVAQDTVAQAVNDAAQTTIDQRSEPKSIQEITNQVNAILEISPQDIVLGDKNAPVTFIEYSSLSCPHCAAFNHEALDRLKKEYIDTGKMKFIHRDFPLNQPALAASLFAVCQAKGNPEKYHKLLKALFKTQDGWAFDRNFIEKLRSIAQLDGMSSQDFENCINNDILQNQILQHRMEASNNLKIQSTPTFFINGEKIEGYVDYVSIQKVIDSKLGK